jgi:hypothetical protein
MFRKHAKKIILILLVLIVFILPACSTHIHVIGDGAKTGIVEQERQWYVLWGLVPINKVNTNEMAKGAKNYTIKTEASVLDVIINIFTSYVSIVSRTVEVQR